MPWEISDKEKEWESHTAARNRAATVGTALLVTSIICALSNVGIALILNAIQQANRQKESPPSWVRQEDWESWERGRAAAPVYQLGCAGLVSLCIYLPVFLGGLKLQQGGGWGLGFAAAIMAMLPCSPGFLLGLPVGIWALIVLSNSDVKLALTPRRRDG